MGMLVDGQWIQSEVTRGAKDDEGGKFVRRPSSFRKRIEKGGEHPPEAGRYHLYVSWACPWAHRTIIVRKLRGLEQAISMEAVDFLMLDDGWRFSPKDSLLGVEYLRDVYVRADAKYTGKVTVPVLWDRAAGTIVNNESRDIIAMLDREMTGGELFYPRAQEKAIDAMIDANYDTVNNGVYKAGFARSQEAYEEAVTALFERLDALEHLLSQQRYLVAGTPTLADWALFTTLLRFDPVYVGHFKCNLRRIADYPSLSGYLRDLYQTPGVAETCNFEHIKGHYYRSHRGINPTGVVPKGPVLDLDAPHGRAALG